MIAGRHGSLNPIQIERMSARGYGDFYWMGIGSEAEEETSRTIF